MSPFCQCCLQQAGSSRAALCTNTSQDGGMFSSLRVDLLTRVRCRQRTLHSASCPASERLSLFRRRLSLSKGRPDRPDKPDLVLVTHLQPLQQELVAG